MTGLGISPHRKPTGRWAEVQRTYLNRESGSSAVNPKPNAGKACHAGVVPGSTWLAGAVMSRTAAQAATAVRDAVEAYRRRAMARTKVTSGRKVAAAW